MDKVTDFFKTNISISTTFGCIVILCFVMICILVCFNKVSFGNVAKTSIYFLIASSIVIYFHDKKLKQKYEDLSNKTRQEDVIKGAVDLDERDILNIFSKKV